MKEILYKLFDHGYLNRNEARTILQNMVKGMYTNEQVASLLTVYQMRSITVDELLGFKEALISMRIPVKLDDYPAIDIVGTGGDGKNTFNISTCSCFVVAGAGHHVVKHGNYGATSISGASNVIEQHGVKFTNNTDQLRRSMEQAGIAYLHAPLFNPAMKSVAPIRKALAVRNFFNMLGPLVNPAQPTYQLLGTYSLPLLRLYAYTYQESGVKYAVVHSLDGYDEISLTSTFKVVNPLTEKLYTPEQLSLPRYTEVELSGGTTQEAAAHIFTAVLQGTSTQAQKDVVVANAAFAIQTITPSKPIADCIAEARHSLDSGKALASFQKFVTLNS